ncbi:type II toxin-antitoxin system MqsR family toxin [Butyrivibrio sp. FC2001]|uniref:type II toxin-antitoxin system MqsR family toxin n=1 Tax=Butyrivibrio sp. FC2001 TaxID=1280671 RepID=UPI0006888EC4|nr:type II toxin-antitoxin system MqsR family toxin [Butyrivibrio sp. FC2001]
MIENLPPPAEKWVINLELVRIKLLLSDPDKIEIAANRKKNMDLFAKLGITATGCLTYLRQLTYENYLSGPEDDRDTGEKDCVWEFGIVINEIDIYIKIVHKVNDNMLVLSFHEAERPLVFRY